jgi:PLP dependent protein
MSRITNIVRDTIFDIQTRIEAARLRSNREARSCRLLAVTKTFPVQSWLDCEQAGHLLIGENYVQEASAKFAEYQSLPSPQAIDLHLIGHLQKNKAKKAVSLFSVIESVDSLDLALEIDRAAASAGKVQRIFIQVNISDEEQKSGVNFRSAGEMFEKILGLKNLRLEGLMSIGRFDLPPEEKRREFRAMRDLAVNLQDNLGLGVLELSMGMSHDFELAVEEGSTIVRVGSAIFGPRQYDQTN